MSPDEINQQTQQAIEPQDYPEKTPSFPAWVPAVIGAIVIGLAGGWYLRGQNPSPDAASKPAAISEKPKPVTLSHEETTPVDSKVASAEPKPIFTVGPPPADAGAGKVEIPKTPGTPLPGLQGSIEPVRPGAVVGGPGSIEVTQHTIETIANANGGKLISSTPSGNGHVFTVQTTAGKVSFLAKRLREAVAMQGVVGDPIYPEEVTEDEDQSVRFLTKKLLDARKRHAELLVSYYADAPNVKDCEREIADIEKQIQKVKNTPPKPGTKTMLEITVRE